MHNGCDIANQMFSNGQLWTWPLIFEICWTRLLSLVVYIWSYLWFSFQVCSTQAVYSFTKWTAWGLAPTEDNRTPGTGRLKRLEHCELMNTYRSWWRHKTSIFRSFRFYLRKEGGGGGKIHFSDIYLKYFLWNSYQVNTTPHWSLVNNDSGNGLVPSSNKPLHEPMFTQISGAIWRH